MNDWYSSLYKSLLIASSVLFLIYLSYSGINSVRALISGFVLLQFAVLMILHSLSRNALIETQNDSTFKILSALQTNTGPFLLTFGIIVFVIACLLKYFDRIVAGHVSPGFNTFSNILILLSFAQIYLIFNSVKLDKKIPTITSGVIYLFGILSGICSLILFTILRYYTTDG